MARLVVDCSNLSIHRTKFIRTGIQEVVYRTLISLARLRRELAPLDLVLLPQFPQRFDGELAIPCQNPLPYMLEEIERVLDLSSEEVWGLDFRGGGYRLSDEELIQTMASADFVHIQSMINIGPLARAFRKRRPGAQPLLSVTVYDLSPVLFPEYCDHGLARWFNQEYVPSLGEFAHQALCISRNTALDVLEDEHTRRIPKVTVLPLPFEFSGGVEAVDVQVKYGLSNGRYVVFLGSLEPRKNFAALLEGFELFCARQPGSDLRLALVGGTGWKNAEFEKKLSRSPANGRITRTGYVSDSELESLLRRAAGLAMLSMYEGYGLPVAQAFSKRVPVMASYGSSLPEACSGHGVFVEPHDPESVCAGFMLIDAGLSGADPTQAGSWTWDNYARNLVKAVISSG